MRLRTICSVMPLALGLSLAAIPAQAQNVGDLSLRLEPGLAVPVGHPQDNIFLPGFWGSAKIGVSLLPELDFGPAVSTLVLPSQVANVDAGTATLFGGYARIKRSHSNTSTGFAAVSPWIEGELSYVRTGLLDRFGTGVQLGAAWPVSDERNVWLGPFVGYTDIFQADPIVAVNTNDSKTFIVGLSVEFGAGPKKPEKALVCPQCKPATVHVPTTPVKEVVLETNITRVEFVETIQFAVNSDKLDAIATAQLNDVLAQIKKAQSYDRIEVDGHASSDGVDKTNQVLALERADAVRSFLIDGGLAGSKIIAVGYGSSDPATSNKTLSGRVQNRRASFVVRIAMIKQGK